MQTQELDRIRYITQTYEALKGLKMVPFGLFMMVIAFRDLGWTWLGETGDCTYTAPLLVMLVGLYFAIDKYYSRTFGVVRVQPKSSPLVYGLILMSIFFGAVAVEVAVKPPISLIGLTISALLIYVGSRTRRGYYIAAGVVMAGISLVPLLPGSNRSFGTFGFWWNMLFGVTWTVLGVVDHWMLVRAMKPTVGGEDAGSDR
jgi:hypothetical protein